MESLLQITEDAMPLIDAHHKAMVAVFRKHQEAFNLLEEEKHERGKDGPSPAHKKLKEEEKNLQIQADAADKALDPYRIRYTAAFEQHQAEQ